MGKPTRGQQRQKRRNEALFRINADRALRGEAPLTELPEFHRLRPGQVQDHPKGSVVSGSMRGPSNYGVRATKASKPNAPQYTGPKFGPVSRRSAFEEGLQ